jgi:hypothetical protein
VTNRVLTALACCGILLAEVDYNAGMTLYLPFAFFALGRVGGEGENEKEYLNRFGIAYAVY